MMKRIVFVMMLVVVATTQVVYAAGPAEDPFMTALKKRFPDSTIKIRLDQYVIEKDLRKPFDDMMKASIARYSQMNNVTIEAAREVIGRSGPMDQMKAAFNENVFGPTKTAQAKKVAKAQEDGEVRNCSEPLYSEHPLWSIRYTCEKAIPTVELDQNPWYEKWWVWTLVVTAVVATGAAVTYGAMEASRDANQRVDIYGGMGSTSRGLEVRF